MKRLLGRPVMAQSLDRPDFSKISRPMARTMPVYEPEIAINIRREDFQKLEQWAVHRNLTIQDALHDILNRHFGR